MIAWRRDLEIGVDEIDAQHKELFDRFNALLFACTQGKGRDEVCRLLHFLNEYVSSHFAAEELLQAESRYPGLVEHRQQHLAFIATLAKLERQLQEEGATVPLVIQTNQTTVSWLMKHISGMDKEFGRFLQRRAA